jgi:hypothetical protein
LAAGFFAAGSAAEDLAPDALRVTRFAAATVLSARLRVVRAMSAGPL